MYLNGGNYRVYATGSRQTLWTKNMTQEILNSVMPDRDGVEMTDDFMNVYKPIPDELIRHLEDGDVVERMTGGPKADDLLVVGYWSRGTVLPIVRPPSRWRYVRVGA